jgi:CHAT domain-containing protein/tetratricopeptide (TPR) repeat protein
VFGLKAGAEFSPRTHANGELSTDDSLSNVYLMTRSPLIGPPPGARFCQGAFRGFAFVLAAQMLQLPAFPQGPTPQRAQPPQAEARKLDPGAPALSKIAPGEMQTYLFSLSAGQFARIVVEQRGVDVSLALRTEAGVVLASVNDLESPRGSEELAFVTEAAGTFRVEVRAAEDGPVTGQYAVSIAEVRAAAPPDRERIAAQRLFMEGNRLLWQKTAASRLRAIEKYEAGALAFRRAGDRSREAGATNSIGLFYFWLGEMRAAFEHCERALSIWREVGDGRGEARALNLLGQLHNSTGEGEKSLAAHRRALEIRRAIEDPLGVIASLDQIGMVYASFGDARRALDYYEQALALCRATGQRRREPKLFASVGEAHEVLGNLKSALEYQTLALAGLRAKNDRNGVANTLRSMGRVHVKTGDFAKALASFEESLAMHRALGNLYRVADMLTNVGEIHYRLGDFRKALEHLRESLAIRRPGGEVPGEAVTRYWIARVLADRGETTDALHEVARAVEIAETLRTSVASQELRASFFATVEQYYELYADLLMRRHAADPAGGHSAAALAVSERARARSLLDLLAEARADIRRGVDAKLLLRERALQHQLNAAAGNYAALGADRRDEAQVAEVAKEVATLEAELDETRAEIRRVSPRYSALVEPRTLGLSEIQKLLDEDTLLVEYKLGDSRSFMWAVTRDDMKSFVLPGRAEVEAAARRLYELLSERNRRLAAETHEQRRARIARAESEYSAVAQSLSRMLLAPVAEALGRRRLVVVADGALHYVPFAALPVPEARVPGVRYQVPELKPSDANSDSTSPPRHPTPDTRYLITDHEVVNLPSASALAVLRKEVEGRQPAPRSVAVLADPVFDRADARVAGSTPSRQRTRRKADVAQEEAGKASPGTPDTLAQSEFMQAAIAAGLPPSGPAIPRLLFSRREAKAILASATDGRGKSALDFSASRATATGAELSQFSHIHFATHGLLNTSQPQLSGIVLSLVDERGRAQDGYLRLHEIYNLDLPAELVVLSACQTGLGKEVRGEGLVGLTRGFMYAGSPRVAASLWKVDDAATAGLMAAFYRGMLKDGLAPAAALRRAQVQMLAQKQWQSPYYWAAFILQGEWK